MENVVCDPQIIVAAAMMIVYRHLFICCMKFN